MKRKVRITAPAANPFESNPMSNWMAQMGGTQMDQNQPTEEEHIYSIAAEMLSQGFDTEEVKKSLATNGFAGAKVNELVDSLVAYMEEQRDLSEAQYLDDELAQEQLLAEEQAAAAEAMEDEALRNQMYNDMYYAESDPGYAEEDAAMQDILMKFGGKVPTKKQFVKQALKLKKKQEGGQEQQNRADDTLSEKRPINDFISSVAQTAQQKAEEEMLEQQYDNYFGTDNDLDEAQRGGERRMMRRANRMMRRMPAAGFMAPGQMFPPQFNIMTAPGMFPMANMFARQMQMPGNVQMANIEVRRTGLFGKPKEYTINFATTPPNQIKLEEVINQEKENIKETIKDTAASEKEKEVSTASKDNEKVQEELVTADQITVKGKGTGTGGKGTSKPQANVTPTATVDAWGRPQGDAWYGFDPETKKFTVKDKWGRSPDSKWYNFDPERKRFVNQVSPVKSIIDKANAAYSSSFKPAPTAVNLVNPYGQLEPEKEENKISSYLSYVPESVLRAANTVAEAPNTFVDQVRRAMRQEGGVTGYDLYKFVYGGDDMMPFADESFMYNSKDTTDPYFKYGGLTEYQDQGQVSEEKVELRDKSGNLVKIVTAAEAARNKEYDKYTQKNVKAEDTKKDTNNTTTTTTTQNNPYPGMYNFPMYPPVFGGRRRFSPYANPAIQYAGSWAQQKGLPFDPRTGKPIMGLPSSNLPISKIDVTKSSLFGKRPKEYTVYYGDYNKGQAPQGTGSAPAGNMSPNQLRQYSGFQNVLANIPGLSKFVRDPKGDYVSREGFVSPKDVEQIGRLPIKPLDFTNASAEELKARAEAQLEGSPMSLATRKASAIPTQSGLQEEPIQRTFPKDERIGEPYFTDEEIAAQNPLVDVQPEDLSQEYTPLPTELAENRDPSLVSPVVNLSGPMAGSNYSFDMPGEGENYPEEYEAPYSPEREYMLESLGRGSSNLPYYPSFSSELPVVGPEGMADYVSQALNYDMSLPSQTPLPQPWMTQDMVDQSARRNAERAAAIKRQQRLNKSTPVNKDQNKTTSKKNPVTENINKEVFDNKAVLNNKDHESYYEFSDKQDIYTDPQTGRQYDKLNPYFKDSEGNFDKKKFDKAIAEGRDAAKKELQEKEVATKKDIERQVKLYKKSGFPTQYVNNPTKMANWLHNKPDMLYWIMEEPQSLYMNGWTDKDIMNLRKTYAKWAKEKGVNDWREKYAKQYDVGTFSKQVGGLAKSSNLSLFNLPMAQAGVNQNSVNNQDDSQIPMLKPKTSQEVWAVTEPQIRQAWGLEETKTPEIEQDPFAVKYRNRNIYDIDSEQGLNIGNNILNSIGLGINALNDRSSLQDFYSNLPFEGQVAKQTMNRGDYDPNSGLFRPDQMGFEGVAQKGGSMYKEGGETYMSAKQIAEYLANGGEIEFI